MDIILCHITADFDTLGAAIGLTRLHPGSKIVLAGGAHPTVQEFLALHRDEYALIERRSVTPEQIRRLYIVDTQQRQRLGKAAEWLDLPQVEVVIYDHHMGLEADSASDITSDIAANEYPVQRHVEAVGSATTLVVEELQAQQILPLPFEATAMALGIHVDTGSLTFDHTTVRDASALTWLMQQGANLNTIGEYVEPGLSPELRDLLAVALDQIQTETVRGCCLAWVLLTTETYVPGLSSLAARLFDLTEADVLLLAVRYRVGEASSSQASSSQASSNQSNENEPRLTVIGRARSTLSTQEIHLGQLLQSEGQSGGGHARAAAMTMRAADPEATLNNLVEQLRAQIPQPLTAREIMSSPVRTIRPETTIAEAQRILLRYGHSGLSVVDADDRLIGIISRRDLDIALHHGFSHAPVKGYMAINLKTITPDTALPEIESLMITYGIGRLPVLSEGQLVGIVTRTDVLRERHQAGLREQNHRTELQEHQPESRSCLLPEVMLPLLSGRLNPALWNLLLQIAAEAERRGWQLYLVGGAVRDLLRAGSSAGGLLLQDIDLVVDGVDGTKTTETGAAGVEMAQAIRQLYPAAKLQVYGRFQTAALVWHNDPTLDSTEIDIATARTEFYPYPAANPEVEASSIQQDLYRRDFTINALAIRLTKPRRGELLDFFGGWLDLQSHQIRVLHANSFIEDPTRIYRAVRFAVRLGFAIEPQTESYIRHAIASGIYRQPAQPEPAKQPALQTRLKQELHYILESPYWQSALRFLDDLGAICCIHPDLNLSSAWPILKRVDRWLKRFQSHLTQTPVQIPVQTVQDWLLLLEVILLQLEPEARVTVAQNFQLPEEAIRRLQQFDSSHAKISTELPSCQRPSQVVELLGQFDLQTLILVSALESRPIRRQIWQYLTHWSQVKAPLDGNDLKAMGYKPGKQFKQILDDLLSATLDGEVSDQDTAKLFLAKQFPTSKTQTTL